MADGADRLREAVRGRYRAFARGEGAGFAYPVGRAGALRLGYDPAILDALPPAVVSRFAGVGHPLSVAPPRPGDRVLDVGCGAGLDVLVAARMVGSGGRAVGIDLVPEMLEQARGDAGGAEFLEGGAESLPFPDGSFDRVISNGVLNLVPDKDAAWREIRRVLRPGGEFAAADLLVTEDVPPEVLADRDAWSA